MASTKNLRVEGIGTDPNQNKNLFNSEEDFDKLL